MSSRPRRFTLRARLAVAYAALASATGALMVAGIYLFMRYVPSYLLMPLTNLDNLDAATALQSLEPSTTGPVVSSAVDAIPVLVSPVVSSTHDVFTLLLTVSISVFVVLAVVGALAGWVVAGRMLRPLQRINRVATRAASGDLSQRIGGDGPRDELSDLSATLDDMLARLERSVGEHQRFAANASHELRTPIATTQTLLDIALADPEIDLATLRRTAERVREMNQRNRETVEALLALADADGGQLRREPVRLDALVQDAVDLEEHAAAGLGVTVEVDAVPSHVLGDPTLLRQAVANLVQNAVRHNQRQGRVEVSVRDEPGYVLLRIENTGIVLEPAVVATLTEPFVRGEGRVAGGRRGHGLGLTLAKRVAHAHDAELDVVARADGGHVVEIWFPAQE